MAKKRVFTSFDFDHDEDLRNLLVGQSRNQDSPFEMTDWSLKEPLTGDWKRKVRDRIKRCDVVCVICGEHTDTATGVSAELSIAQDEVVPYVLLRGRANKVCKKPLAARSTDKMYDWTWDILKKLIGGARQGEFTMPALKTYRIFVSHSWTYSDAYEKLCALLDQAANFTYANYSVPKDDPIHDAPSERGLYQAIKDQMVPCHVVLIMAGVYSTYSKWINKEIAIAKNEFSSSKPIIGIRPWAQTNVSTAVSDNADVMVGWNTDSIVAAIREYSL